MKPRSNSRKKCRLNKKVMFVVSVCCVFSDISSESVHDVVDSRRIGVTSASSLPVWNRSESACTSWSAAAAVSNLTYRILSPLPVLDGDRQAGFDEDSDVVDRATLPRATKRSSYSLPVNSPSSTLNVCLLF